MALKSSEKSLENQEPEIIFKIGTNYLYAETYRDMFAQVKKRYGLPYAYDTFLKTVKAITPTAQDKHFVEYDFTVPETYQVSSQTETIIQLPKSALLR